MQRFKKTVPSLSKLHKTTMGEGKVMLLEEEERRGKIAAEGKDAAMTRIPESVTTVILQGI